MAHTSIGLSIAILLAFGSLRDCSILSRYKRETYDCTATQAPFSRVTFESVVLGDEASVEGNSPTRAHITQIDELHVETTWGEGKIKVNRITGAVLVIQNGMVSSYNCKRSYFKM